MDVSTIGYCPVLIAGRDNEVTTLITMGIRQYPGGAGDGKTKKNHSATLNTYERPQMLQNWQTNVNIFGIACMTIFGITIGNTFK